MTVNLKVGNKCDTLQQFVLFCTTNNFPNLHPHVINSILLFIYSSAYTCSMLYVGRATYILAKRLNMEMNMARSWNIKFCHLL